MNILHITDLHFSVTDREEITKKKWKKIKKILVETLSEINIDVVAVTGDLTSHGAPKEFQQAEKYLIKMTKYLGIHRTQMLFCPGNHDADTDDEGASFFHYQAFLKNFYQGKFPEYLVKGRYHFLLTNTCQATSSIFFDNAILPQNVLEQLAQVKKEEYGILLMHHQPEVIKNQDMFQKLAESGSVNLLLCGHLHSTETRAYQVEKTVVVNGMAIKPHLAFIPSGIQLICIKRKKIQIVELKL